MKIKRKSKSALMKRIRITKSSRIKRKSAYTSHLALHKTTKQKRQARKGDTIDATDYKRLKKLI